MRDKQYLSIYLPGWAKHPEQAAAAEALRLLAAWAMRFTPLVALGDGAPDPLPADTGVLLDLTGTERLHDGCEALIEKISAKLERRGAESRFAAAGSIGAAWALARYGKDRIAVVRGSPRAALEPLPVRALRVPEDTIAGLREIGVRTIGALLALPRKEIGVRFGALLVKRLDEALGTVPERFSAFVPEERCFVRRAFESPIVSRTLLCAAAAEMLAGLTARLDRQGSSARSFLLVVESRSEAGERSSLTRELSPFTAHANTAHLAAIIEPVCEKLPLAGGVTAISLVARETGAALRTQRGLLPGSEANDSARAFTELLDHCAVRLGNGAVRRAVLKESYVPERAYEFVAAAEEAKDRGTPTARNDGHTLDYPPYLFPEAEPARAVALLPDHPPARLTWRSREHEIVCGIGPARVSPEWWRESGPHEREYFKVQDGVGRWLWVYRDRATMEWFVQGIWV